MENEIWHNMDDEPYRCCVILYSSSNDRLYDGEYVGNDNYMVDNIIINKSQFTYWAKRNEFFNKIELPI